MDVSGAVQVGGWETEHYSPGDAGAGGTERGQSERKVGSRDGDGRRTKREACQAPGWGPQCWRLWPGGESVLQGRMRLPGVAVRRPGWGGWHVVVRRKRELKTVLRRSCAGKEDGVWEA